MVNFNPKTIAVGESLPEIDFGPITRSTLALYAGASGDHNPIHIDSDFAKATGLPDVFAQGMLSFGALARVVTAWAGVRRLRSFGCRFTAVTQVHDRLTLRATVEERLELEGEPCARLSLVAVTHDGRETLKGEALVALA